MKEINQHIERIKTLCDSYDVRALFAFGSVLTDKFRPESDVDLVIDIADKDPFSYSEKYFNIKSELEQMFKRDIDLLEQKEIRNPYLKAEIDKTKVLIYGK